MSVPKKKNISKKAKTALKKDPGAHKKFLTVALGASAGGIKALLDFFSALPEDSGMAFVVILHLSQTHKSSLAEILQRKTKMKVMQVEDTVKVKPNEVYVIPPAKHLEMKDGVITLKEPEPIKGIRVPIDRFFRTMADAYGSKAVCIILSGTGSDGTRGMKHVKSQGGFAIVQDPEEAEYDGMPSSAIATQIADVVLPVARMPEKLLFVRDTTKKWKLADGDGEAMSSEIKNMEMLRDVLTFLRVRTGHDFSNYKRPTLIRRLARHLQIHETDDLKQYLNILREKPEEVLSLLKNLLINVTGFFRDREAFEALENEIIPELFKGKEPSDQVRVWIAGCSTGEEAYSIAMLLTEYADQLPDPPKLLVFASDVDEDAINEAREGRFTEPGISDVPPERLRRFFTKKGSNVYLVKKAIREMILFAPHNLLQDPPFSRLDLVSCRNVLIYLNRKTQAQALQIFHFALHPNGYLFLGSSETADSAPNQFSAIDKKQRLFQCRPSNQSWPSVPSLPVQRLWRPRVHHSDTDMQDDFRSFGQLHYRLIEHFAPPSALVDGEGQILHLSEHAGRFLRFVGGEPSANIMKVVHPDLQSDLRTALFTAHKDHKTVETKKIRVQFDGNEKLVNLTVRPLETPDAEALILFEEHSENAPGQEEPQSAVSGDQAMESVIRRMEEEMAHTKDRLRNTIEQNEASTEELKASNEELQAINEELRSASEELETSKEELQSVNEELTTVNHELKDKIEEVSHANSDMQNLIRSTDIATIFLDRNLNIKRFTPRTTDIFNIIPGDLGRPLGHITHRLSPDDFQKDAAGVLDHLQPLEREVISIDGRCFIARFSPYRTEDNKIDGVTLTFVDITETKRTSRELLESREKYHTLFNSIDEGFCIIEVLFDQQDHPYDYRFLEVNHAFEIQTGLNDPIGKTIKSLAPEYEQYWFDTFGLVAKTKKPIRFENEAKAIGHYYEAYAFPIGEPGNNKVAVLFKDIRERKLIEARKAFLSRLNNTILPLSDPTKVAKEVTRLTLDFFGADRCYYCEIESGKAIILQEASLGELPSLIGVSPLESPAFFKTVLEADRPFVVEDVQTSDRMDPNLRELFLQLQVVSLLGAPVIKNGNPVGLLCIFQNAHRQWKPLDMELALETAERTWAAVERTKIEKALQKNKVRLQLANRAAGTGTFVYFPEEDRSEPDNRMLELWGLKPGDTLNFEKAITDIIHPEDRPRFANGLKIILGDKGPKEFNTDIHILHPDGSEHWLNVIARMVPKENNLKRLAGVSIDITLRKTMEEALYNSETNYSAIVNQTIAGILKLDLEGNFTFSNQQMAKMLGYTVEELLKKTMAEVVHPKDMEKNLRLFGHLKKEGRPYEIEKRLLRKDGSYIWVNNQVSPILNQKGDATEAVVISVDITNQKATEQQKNDFISIASHELKTPLTGISAYSELLLDQFSDQKDPEFTNLIQKLNKQVMRLNRLIYGLLDTNRISEGRFDLHYERFDLNQLIEERISEAQITASGFKMKFHKGKLRPIFADKERIGQVLTNLISNAVKYSPHSNRILITSEELEDEKVKVRVRDYGLGLRPELQDQIFKRFYRALDSGHASGFGLGLYIAKEIIKLHFGEIGVEIPKTGSTFYFVLPYRPKGEKL